MSYELRYSHEAVGQLKALRAFDRAAILDQIEQMLGTNPTLESKAKVKKLRQPAPTQFRLRVGEFRIFYDVEETTVNIVQILTKQEAMRFLEEES